MEHGPLGGTRINVRAHISFLTSLKGGQGSDIHSTYRPLHNLGSPENRELWFDQISLDLDDKISPGENRDVLINSDPNSIAELTPGRTWRIQEGAQLVAMAKVIETTSKS
jgi:hypothetical protein